MLLHYVRTTLLYCEPLHCALSKAVVKPGKLLPATLVFPTEVRSEPHATALCAYDFVVV